MISFKQFINEDDTNLTFKELVERDCQPFLKESKQTGLIYRGINEASMRIDAAKSVLPTAEALQSRAIMYWEKSVRSDRQPKDTNRQQHQIIDDWFKTKFGFGARSQAMFCLGETGKKLLRHYGTPMIVFPIGEFKYVWSPSVKDLYNEVGQETHLLQDEDKLVDYLNDCRYIDSHLHKAVNMSHEIMIKCDRYYAFDIHAEHLIKLALDMTP